MIIKQVAPNPNCTVCGGCGETYENHPWGNTTATEVLMCECLFDTLTDQELDEYELGILDIVVIGIVEE